MSVKRPYKVITLSEGSIEIYGNNHDVPLIHGYELSPKERKEFDYYENEEDLNDNFTGFRYKGWIYDLGDFMRLDNNSPFKGIFDGSISDTYFSGIGIKLSEDGDFIKVYTWYCHS